MPAPGCSPFRLTDLFLSGLSGLFLLSAFTNAPARLLLSGDAGPRRSRRCPEHACLPPIAALVRCTVTRVSAPRTVAISCSLSTAIFRPGSLSAADLLAPYAYCCLPYFLRAAYLTAAFLPSLLLPSLPPPPPPPAGPLEPPACQSSLTNRIGRRISDDLSIEARLRHTLASAGRLGRFTNPTVAVLRRVPGPGNGCPVGASDRLSDPRARIQKTCSVAEAASEPGCSACERWTLPDRRRPASGHPEEHRLVHRSSSFTVFRVRFAVLGSPARDPGGLVVLRTCACSRPTRAPAGALQSDGRFFDSPGSEGDPRVSATEPSARLHRRPPNRALTPRRPPVCAAALGCLRVTWWLSVPRQGIQKAGLLAAERTAGPTSEPVLRLRAAASPSAIRARIPEVNDPASVRTSWRSLSSVLGSPARDSKRGRRPSLPPGFSAVLRTVVGFALPLVPPPAKASGR